YLKATDENDLTVPDGRAEIVVTTKSASNYNAEQVFVPDTLWKHKLILDAIGETKLVLPDSIFPKADIAYSANVTFLNSNNERQSETKYLNFKQERSAIEAKVNKDTLFLDYKISSKSVVKKATVTLQNIEEDAIDSVVVQLPAKLLINTSAASYYVETDFLDETVEMDTYKAELNVNALRTKDSLFIQVENPHRITFWYTVFAGNKIIDQGRGTSLNYSRKYQNKGYVFLLLNYIWADKAEKQETTIPYQENILNVSVNQPLAIYPGEKTSIEVSVKKSDGSPATGVDVTAWSFTRKFEDYNTPNIPYLGKYYSQRKRKRDLGLQNVEKDGDFHLNWVRWSKEMGLDSIEYFKFTHANPIYRIEEKANESITQIAPFLVKNGEIIPVHVLYIDEIPVYFSQTKQLERYSFAVDSGRHSLKFRTINQLISVDSILVSKGRKLILSLNADSLINAGLTYKKMPDTLTHYEAKFLSNYFISVVSNFGGKLASVQQEKKIFLLNPTPENNANLPQLLIGPLPFQYADFSSGEHKQAQFLAESGYSYLFEPGLITKKATRAPYLFDTNLLKAKGATDYRQQVLTTNEVETIWRNYLDLRSYSTDLFKNDYITSKNNGKLILEIIKPKIHDPAFVKNIILYRYDNPDYIRIYRGNNTDLGYLEHGKYRLFFLLKDQDYLIKEDIVIKPNGTNFYKVNFDKVKQKDIISSTVNVIIQNRFNMYESGTYKGKEDVEALKETFNDKFTDVSTFGYQMSGTVYDFQDKQPVIGASVKIKGSNIGTSTDIHGRFKINVPTHGKLVIAYIGYKPEEVTIAPGENVAVYLKATVSSLQEVVVVGYSSQRRKDVTGSVSIVSGQLQGRVAGVMIRGIGTLKNDAKPLVIVDGLPFNGNMDSLSPDLITNTKVLSANEATAIYGAMGANGVIVITTKNKKSTSELNAGVPDQQQTLRTNFSDYAFWQPKLKTNEQGIAKFSVKFPDDITNWRTFFVGMSGNKQSGFAEGQIKSFKSLSANFTSPLFAIKGDKFRAIAKVMNYTADTLTVNRSFTYNGIIIKQDRINLKNSAIDSLTMAADVTKDSLQFEYTIKRDNGYFDGEKRTIPTFEQGVRETKGFFNALENDTTVTYKFNNALGKITLRAEASVLPTLLEETEKLRNYEYLCNEQLASKLKGLLAQKRIKKYLDEPFKWDKQVNELIKKLQEGRKQTGTWGWWNNSNEELWISLHAVEALIDAEKEGYKTFLDRQKIIDYLNIKLSSYKGFDKLTAIEILQKIGAKSNFKELITNYEKELPLNAKISSQDKYRLMIIKQWANMPVSLDSLILTKRSTMFGNIYWGESSYYFFNNSVELSVLAYKLLKQEGKHAEMLPLIRNYFLEQRKSGQWNNTYQSALILETILPDLLTANKKPSPSSLKLSGGLNETVSKFPFTTTLTNPADIRIEKTGDLPVYVTAYQQFWNKNPQKESKDFTVNTWFEKNGLPVTMLSGGTPVLLKAAVIARADAEYVLVEIPIPAGCSYDSKEQVYGNNEVHREYFKNKVSIFCRLLKQGKYTFQVKLLPRYGGEYILNPAKAEMMYFPVFYGREGMKRVVVE
ncbi:MAG: hypothetical protein JWQ25_1362, partial [Daejeonella sp.]|nr:hypothetical protein [Daejeonella sp.]